MSAALRGSLEWVQQGGKAEKRNRKGADMSEDDPDDLGHSDHHPSKRRKLHNDNIIPKSSRWNPMVNHILDFKESTTPLHVSILPFHGDYSNCSSPMAKARLAWSLAFNHTPYTSFLMVDDLNNASGITDSEFLEDPNSILRAFDREDQVLLDKAVQGESADPTSLRAKLRAPRSGHLGRCTSFAVEVVTELLRAFPEEFDFKYFDLRPTQGHSGGHRVAVCIKTGVYIDSTTIEGPMVLEKGEQNSYEQPSGQLKLFYDDNLSKRTRPNGTKWQAFEDVTPDIVLSLCYRDLFATYEKQNGDHEERTTPQVLRPVCRFRHVDFEPSGTKAGTVSWYGVIRWDIPKKQLELIPNLEAYQAGNMDQVEFYKWGDGGDIDGTFLIDKTFSFMENHGGPNRESQSAGCYGLCQRYIRAAYEVWGKPRLM